MVHDKPDGAIELTFPLSLQRVVDKVQGTDLDAKQLQNGKVAAESVVPSEDDNDSERRLEAMGKEKAELMDLARCITLENRNGWLVRL